MNKADMWRVGALVGGVAIVALLLFSRAGGAGAGAGIRTGDIVIPPYPELPPFTFPTFDWAELQLPNFPGFGQQPGYSPAQCGCGCNERQVLFEDTWLDAVSEGITNAFRDEFSRFNYVLPQTVQTLIATGGVRAYTEAGAY